MDFEALCAHKINLFLKSDETRKEVNDIVKRKQKIYQDGEIYAWRRIKGVRRVDNTRNGEESLNK